MERIHRIGRPGKNKIGPVIVRLYNYNEKISLFKNCAKLKGTGISISDDYSHETLQIRKRLWQSGLDDSLPNDKLKLVRDKLFVNGNVYAWDKAKNCKVLLHKNTKSDD